MPPIKWRVNYWETYFANGEAPIDLPKLDALDRPVQPMLTVRYPRKIFIREDSLKSFVAELTPTPPAIANTARGKYLTKNTVTEFVRSYIEQTSNPTKTGLRKFVAAPGYVGERGIYEPEYARQMLKRGTPIKRGRPEI